MSASDLPPRVTFLHGETLHAISLPPLASFLSDLESPEHLLKLKDLLDRYRTPKSYHRIDVRLVVSSELPLDDPPSSQEVERKERERGHPIELALGQPLEPAIQPISYTHVDDAGPQAPVNATVGPSRISSRPTPPTEPDPGGQLLTTETNLLEDTLDISSKNATSSLNPIMNTAPSPPAPTHPLPPSGPQRRVRELRLDLRSLDAAALFHLETWRREVLSLDRLDLELPDSIWYKESTPTPPPSPSPPPRSSTDVKKRGRPRKNTVPVVEPMVVSENKDPSLEVDGFSSLAMTSDQMDGYKSLVEGLTAPSESQPIDDLIPSSSLSDALGELARQVIQADHEMQEPQPVFETIDGTTLPSLEASLRSASPDVMLDDAFNEKETDDPDFVPPDSPPPKPDQGYKNKRKAIVSYDLSDIEKIREVANQSGQDQDDVTSESTPSIKHLNGAPPKSAYDESGPLVRYPLENTRRRRKSSANTSVDGSVTLEGQKSGQKKRRERMFNVEIPIKKRKSNISPLKESTSVEQKTVQVNTVSGNGDSDDEDEDDEWGFLRQR